MIKTATTILALALATPAFGMVFSWTDSAGVKHYTNRRDEIPERYRAKAKPLYPEQADTLPAPQGATPQTVKPEVSPPVPPAVQRVVPQDLPHIPPAVVAPAPSAGESAPPATRRARSRPRNNRDE